MRTNPVAVQAVLGSDYGPRADGTLPSLLPYIEAANDAVSTAVVYAAKKGISLSSTTRELMERWLAAHYYTKMDPVYTTKSTDKASASFVRGQREPEPYKDVATGLDPSGSLSALLNQKVVGGAWLGTRAGAQVPWSQRN